jgi:hypothetical protein
MSVATGSDRRYVGFEQAGRPSIGQKGDAGAEHPNWSVAAVSNSNITRARLHRVFLTFAEVHAETGSLTRSIRHTVRFVGKKLVPLARYAGFTITRSFVTRRLRSMNARLVADVPVIGLRILGGIGDYIVIARFVRDVCAFAGPAVFDIYSNKPGLVSWIFGSVPGFRASYDEAVFDPARSLYTVAAQISQFVVIDEDSFHRGRLAAHPGLRQVVTAIRRFRPSIESIIAQQPRLDSFLAQKAIFANRDRRDFLHFMAGVPYGGDRLEIEASDDQRIARGLDGRLYITVHNGYDPNMVVSNERATKCYPFFGAVISRLRQLRGDIVFVQVGIHTSERIAEADLQLLGKTSLRETAGLIAGAILHLDNEGGLVHLARSLGTPSCVVFGPTSSRYFGYPDNINIDPLFCGGCWWVKETWMNHCPRGFETARCMTEQPASAIVNAVVRFLDATQSCQTLTNPLNEENCSAVESP